MRMAQITGIRAPPIGQSELSEILPLCQWKQLEPESCFLPLPIMDHPEASVPSPFPGFNEILQRFMRNARIVDSVNQFSDSVPSASGKEKCILSTKFVPAARHFSLDNDRAAPFGQSQSFPADTILAFHRSTPSRVKRSSVRDQSANA